MVRRLLCLLLVEPSVHQDGSQITHMAATEVGLNVQHVLKTFEEMKDAGSRYRNLERALGTGVVFILGQTLPETQYVSDRVDVTALFFSPVYSWTKLLPKSGDKFDRVVRHLQTVFTPNLQMFLPELRKAVIQQKQGDLRSAWAQHTSLNCDFSALSPARSLNDPSHYTYQAQDDYSTFGNFSME